MRHEATDVDIGIRGDCNGCWGDILFGDLGRLIVEVW